MVLNGVVNFDALQKKLAFRLFPGVSNAMISSLRLDKALYNEAVLRVLNRFNRIPTKFNGGTFSYVNCFCCDRLSVTSHQVPETSFFVCFFDFILLTKEEVIKYILILSYLRLNSEF